jgi:putative ABC transport system permease protein
VCPQIEFDPAECRQNLMLRATLRTAVAHKGRLILSTVSIVLGVAFVTGTLMLTSALDRTFVDIIEGSAQDVQITRESAVTVDLTTDPGDGAPLLVPQRVVDEVSTLDGVTAAQGSINRNGVYLTDSGGEVVGAVGPPALGLSWSTDPLVSVTTITQGRAPEANNEVVVDDVTFPKLGYSIGDRMTILTPGGETQAELVGSFKFGETGGLAGATLTAFTPERAQALLTKPGEWTAVDVAVADGFTDEAVATSIQQVLDSDAQDEGLIAKTRAVQVEEQSDSLRQGLAFFNYILIGFAAISLFVAAFLIYNTFSILIAQRGRELALMRAIGATRFQVLRSVLIEALLVALFSVVVGIAVGYLLALGLGALFDAIGLSLTSGIAITVSSVVWATVIGIVVTLVSAAVPAIRASRIPPIAALRELNSSGEGVGRIRTISGFVLLAISAVLIAVGLQGSDDGANAAQTGAGALLLLIAVVVLTPLLGVGLVTLATPVLSAIGGTPGKLASRNAARAPKRLATTASALTIGLGLVVGVTVITASAQTSLDKLIDQTFRAEAIVSTVTSQPFSPTIADSIREVDGVQYVVSESTGGVSVDGVEQEISAIGGGPLDAVYSVENVTGEFGDLTRGNAVVSNDLATERGWSLGTSVPVLFPSGDQQSFTIIGQFEQTPLLSGLVIPLDDYRAAGGGSQDRFLFVAVESGSDPATVLAGVTEAAAVNPLVGVLDQSELKQENADQLNQLLYFVYAMLALSVVIAALGVVNTLALSVIERTREIGLLRAVGATRRQIRRIIRWEAIVVALLGAVLGIAIGITAGTVLQRALVDSGIEVLDIPVTTLIVILALAVVIGILAAVLPARRAARMNILDAISDE